MIRTFKLTREKEEDGGAEQHSSQLQLHGFSVCLYQMTDSHVIFCFYKNTPAVL